MGIQIICIGTELLTGETLNSNLQYLAGELNAHGYLVDYECCIHDDPEVMKRVFEKAVSEHELVLTVGGLGPTKDDRTKAVAAEVMGMPLYLDEALATKIRERYFSRGRKVPDSSWQSQGQVPKGAAILNNEWGTAPGLWCQKDNRVLAMLPGPPRELKPIFQTELLPRILKERPPQVSRQMVAIFGMGESTIEKHVDKALQGFDDVDQSFCLKKDCCHVRLTVPRGQEERMNEALELLKEEFGDALRDVHTTLVGVIVESLRHHGMTLGTAESCTGGGIATEITNIAGVSDVFAGSIVSYSNEIKIKQLGVSAESLEKEGAVSETVAREMVKGAQKNLGVDVAIAVTGIAGPSGGSDEKPVGTVHIATAIKDDIVHSQHVFPYDRAGVRRRTINVAFNQLSKQLNML